ncbi:MAG TPA: hypothetical protein VG297_11690 [Bryobacteraceae bacterium]|jgi:hypothetical protein|nr:hypothetical protein [Bryobacteraceae bacterium]
MEEQKFSADEVLRDAGADGPVRGGTFLQRTGLTLAAYVGALAGIVVIALVAKWMFYAPALPTIPSDTDPAATKIILENYKTLQQATLEPFTSLFDSIVVKVLLPVFTSILGYIFGTRTQGEH